MCGPQVVCTRTSGGLYRSQVVYKGSQVVRTGPEKHCVNLRWSTRTSDGPAGSHCGLCSSEVSVWSVWTLRWIIQLSGTVRYIFMGGPQVGAGAQCRLAAVCPFWPQGCQHSSKWWNASRSSPCYGFSHGPIYHLNKMARETTAVEKSCGTHSKSRILPAVFQQQHGEYTDPSLPGSAWCTSTTVTTGPLEQGLLKTKP